MKPRLKEHYENVVIQNLQKKYSMSNKNMVPKFVKIVLNMGLGVEGNDKKKLKKDLYKKQL